MKKIRIAIISLMIITSVLMLTACGGTKKIKLNGDITGEVKSNGDVSVTGNNGESLNMGDDLKWPKKNMGSLPEPKCKITAVANDEKTKLCTVFFSDMTMEDAKEYIEKIKKLGYTGGMLLSESDTLMISGTAKDNSEATFTYNSTAKEGTVSYKAKGEGNSNSNQSNTTIDLTGNAEWPKNFIKGVPELKGNINGVVDDGGNTVTISIENVDKADFEAYIDQLKKNGYSEDVDEIKTESSIEFIGYSAERDCIRVLLTIEDGNNCAVVEMEKASN